MANPPTPTYTLAHPVYLDVPMMVSFLAALEGGVSVGGKETASEGGTNERTLSAKTGIRARIFGVADGELAAEGSTQKRDETSFVLQTERHHTAASLFNVLYSILTADKLIQTISSPDELKGTEPGTIVEISGEYSGNPLEDILGLYAAFFPYFGGQQPPQTAVQPNPKSGNPAKRGPAGAASPASKNSDADGVNFLIRMAEDIEKAPVHDLLFTTSEGLSCVATVDSRFLTPATSESLREGRFGVIGKVTRVLTDGESINLVRRTVIGAAGPELARQIVAQFNGIEGLSLRVADPIVTGPALQILPMAIFV